MYCPECGAKLNTPSKYCPNCGALIPGTGNYIHTEVERAQINNIFPNFKEYLDKYISHVTVFTSAEAYLSDAKPLRWRWPVILFASLLSGCLINIGMALVVFLISFIIIRIICSVGIVKINAKKYAMCGKTISIDQLAQFLEKALSDLPFSGWKRGTPTVLLLGSTGQLAVECLFQNKTYHRIVFDPQKPDAYTIQVARATGKERLKDCSSSPVLCYKNDFLTRPILEAAMKYYIRYVAS